MAGLYIISTILLSLFGHYFYIIGPIHRLVSFVQTLVFGLSFIWTPLIMLKTYQILVAGEMLCRISRAVKKQSRIPSRYLRMKALLTGNSFTMIQVGLIQNNAFAWKILFTERAKQEWFDA
jgi:hypothetical protein